MRNRMTRDEAISALKRKQGSRSLRKFALAIGVSAAYLSDVYLGRRDLGPKLLQFLGMTKTRTTNVTYQRAK